MSSIISPEKQWETIICLPTPRGPESNLKPHNAPDFSRNNNDNNDNNVNNDDNNNNRFEKFGTSFWAFFVFVFVCCFFCGGGGRGEDGRPILINWQLVSKVP